MEVDDNASSIWFQKLWKTLGLNTFFEVAYKLESPMVRYADSVPKVTKGNMVTTDPSIMLITSADF